jgi:hypothetical protein
MERAMKTQEIQSRDWPMFLAEFSREHRGDTCSVVTWDASAGGQPIAEHTPLLAVAADPSCQRASRIEVLCAGDVPAANIAYDIASPTHVFLARGEDGREVALEIESNDAARTLISLEEPA